MRLATVPALVFALFAPDSTAGQLSAAGNRIFEQGGELGGVAEGGDYFGFALAVGDFDGDGFDDLAIGAPREGLANLDSVGAIHIVYGSRAGLDGAGDQYISQDDSGVPGAQQASAQFGYALATIDFDCDGFDDLAIGVPGRDFGLPPGGDNDAGEVVILRGSAAGITTSGARRFDQDDGWGADDGTEGGDEFGAALVAVSNGSDSNPVRRLYVGAPGEGVAFGSLGNQGAIFGLNSTCDSDGLMPHDRLHQDTGDFDGAVEDDDRFGETLGKGDFDGDGIDDLVIGVPAESFGDEPAGERAGMVHVVYGTSAGSWTGLAEEAWHQDSDDILDAPERNEGFGRSIAAADFDSDGFDDLAIGVYEDVGGGVHVIYGSAAELSGAGDQIWSQDGAIPGTPESSDLFGNAIATGDFDGDGTADLGVGSPGESVGSVPVAGSVTAIRGVLGFGLDSPGSVAFDQDSPGIAGVAEAEDGLGTTLASGDFNGDGRDDLAVGIPFEAIGPELLAGAVQVIYGSDGGILGEVGFTTASVAVVTENPINVTLTVRRVGPTNLAATVGHRLRAGGTATVGVDFGYTPGNLSWAAGDATDREIVVQVFEDFDFEPTEFLEVELHTPSAGTGIDSPSLRRVQINDDSDSVIFRDGFESGSTSAWSSAAP